LSQHSWLKQLAASNGTATGEGGDDADAMENWFDIVSKKHMNELGLLIKSASKVLFPPTKGHGAQRVTGKSFDLSK